MKVYWRPHHEVYTELAPDQDFLGFDEETATSIGRVYLMKHTQHSGRWLWTMFAHLASGGAPLPITG